jgi:hypothetical protein
MGAHIVAVDPLQSEEGFMTPRAWIPAQNP